MWEKTVVKTLFGWEPQWDFEWSWNAMRLQILTRPKWERQLYSSHEAPSCFRLNHFVSLHGHWCNCLDSSQRQKTNMFRKLQLLITTTSKGIFQFLAGVSFVFVVWNPIFCFLHGVSCPYFPEYWRDSSVMPQKFRGVWIHFFIFDPF